MSRRPLRVLVYVPVVWPDASRRRLVRQVKGLTDAARRVGGKVTLLAAAGDLAGRPIPWPTSVFRPARVLPPAKYEPHSLPTAPGEAFDQLLAAAPDHDVLFLPQPFGALPTDSRLEIPLPVVLGIDDLPFDRTDYGARSDKFRREIRRLVGLAAGFVFPTDVVRNEVVSRYAASPARSGVVPATASRIDADHAAARRRYGLPERYALSVGWTRDAAVAEAVADGLPLPFVGVSEAIDLPPYSGLEQRDAADRHRRRLADAGREWFDLTAVDDDDLPALVKGAAVLLAAGVSDWYALAARASGLPVVTPVEFAGRPAELAAAMRESVGSTPEAGPADVSADDALLDRLAEAAADPLQTRPLVRVEPVPRDRRVAWLISHTTLRDAEVPLLQSLGYEVFTNKVLPSGEDYRSGSVDYSWDAGLTLPSHALEALNRFNFYQTDLDSDTVEVLNAYFGTVVCAAYPLMLRQLVKHFRGRILIRVFGREHPLNYGDYFSQFAQGWFWQKVWKEQHRVWLSACYAAIPPIEAPLLKQRTALMPVAMPDWSLRPRGRWTGGDRRVLFVCPSIKTAAHYYGVIYERFKKVYGDFPHVIGGSQPIKVDDPHVTGFLSDDQYAKYFRELQVMYYHSREPRHIHYHPLEAILYGMPVVYMRGGLMEAFDTGSQAGACHTDAEARDKLRRVLDGDEQLIRDIQQSQATILDEFLPDSVRERWEQGFVGRVMRESCIPDVTSALPEAIELSAGGFDSRPVVAGEYALARLGRGELLAATVEVKAEEPAPPGVKPPPPPVVVEFPPPPAPLSRKERAKRIIPPWLHPIARPVFRVMRAVKRRLMVPPAPPAPLLPPPPLVETVVTETVVAVAEPQPTPEQLDERYLNDPPPQPDRDPLPAIAAAPLSLEKLRGMLDKADVTAVVDPVGTLDPNLPADGLRTERVVVGFSDLAWEYGDVFGPLTASATREALLWCRLAAHAVFGSEADRRLAVQRYRLDPARTSVLPALTLTGGVDLSAPAPLPADVRGRWCLPTGYILGYDVPTLEANSLPVYRALRILTRRGVKLGAVLLTGAVEEANPGRANQRLADEMKKAREECGLIDGQSLYVVPGLPERERAALERDAAVSLVTARSGGWAARDVARAALGRVPVIACDSPALTGAGDPTGGNLLLVPPDDPVALADALERTLRNAEETTARTDRAYQAAKQANAPRRLQEFDRLLAAVAGTLTNAGRRATG